MENVRIQLPGGQTTSPELAAKVWLGRTEYNPHEIDRLMHGFGGPIASCAISGAYRSNDSLHPSEDAAITCEHQ